MENAELSPVQEWNILLILTGGTICTSVENGLRSLSSDTAELRLTEDFRKSDSLCRTGCFHARTEIQYPERKYDCCRVE